jgi:hypothetical protein
LVNILDRELDIGDVFVVRQHERFAQDLGFDVVAIAHLDGAHPGQIDDLVALNGIGEAPVQPRGGHLRELAESEYHPPLTFHDDVETAREPSDQHCQGDQARSAAQLPGTRRFTGIPPSAAAPAEQAVQLLVEVAPHLVEVGWALVASASLAPLRVVQ